MTTKDATVYLTSTFEKSLKTDGGLETLTIEGYANTNAVDRQGDVIPSKAWETGLGNYLKNPIILAHHRYDQPIGKMVDYRIDDKGLWIKAEVSSAAGQTYDLIKAGVLTAFSVGFRVNDAGYDSVNDLFIIKDLELLEISVVAVPANQDSLFALAKSFETTEEYTSFKKLYASDEILDKGQVTDEDYTPRKNKGILDMDPKELAEITAQAASNAAKQAVAEMMAANAANEKAAKEAADAEAAMRDSIKKEIATQIEVGQSGTEKLVAEINKRFEEAETKHKSALDGLHQEIKDKAAEIDALNKSKMSFGDKNAQKDADYAEKESAVLLSVMMGRKGVDSTKYGRSIIEKIGPHSASATWETEVSMNMEAEIRKRLVVAPIVKAINMQTNVMKIPLNPDTGVGTWVTNAQFGTTNSAGATQTHQLSEITLSAYKVATNEYLNFEEEEDSLIVLTPIIRDAMIRRVARAVDIAYLRGAGAGSDPVKGFATWATANTNNAVGTKVTVAQLRDMRKNLGWYGLDPKEVIYVVSSDVYYDLLEDTTFQSMNQVGNQATLLTGQIGQIGNSPVLISGEFETKAATKIGAVAINPANFLAGNQRGLRFDTQDLVETQRRVLVSSLRTGMTQLTTNNGMGVAKMTWTA